MKASMLFALALAATCAPAKAGTLDALKASNRLDCGVVQNIDDWNHANLHGDLSALEGDICRAVGVALFGDDKTTKIDAFPGETEAVQALHAGRVQLVVGLTPSAGIAMKYGLAYARPVFYDSQRVLVDQASGVADLAGLGGKLICALDQTPPERVLRDAMTARDLTYGLQAHSEQGEMDAAVAVRRCAAGTALESRLAQSRSGFHAHVGDFVFLPERLTLDPIAPAYRQDNPEFGLLVDWTISALIEAEALGVGRANVEAARKRTDMRVERLTGGDFGTAQAFGLAHDWALKVVAATGNYGEIFDRTVGKPYGLARGLNALWTQGGLMAPAPLQ